jgi:CBS domain-containing protein
MRIADILANKGSDVATIGPDVSVSDAVSALASHRIGALVVSDDGIHPEGIVSERDIVRHLEGDHEGLLARPVRSIMTAPVHTSGPDDDVEGVMQTMTNERFRHLPIVDDDGALVGIVSIGDVVKATIEKLELDRKLLEDYITAR